MRMSLKIYLQYKFHNFGNSIREFDWKDTFFKFLLNATFVYLICIGYGLIPLNSIAYGLVLSNVIVYFYFDYIKRDHIGWYRKRRKEMIIGGLGK